MATQTQTETTSQSIRAIASIPRGPVTSALNFYSPPPDGSKPHNYVEAPPPGQPQRNYGDDTVSVTIDDVRGRESDFDINTNAFATLKDVPPSAEKSFSDNASIKANYYPEVEELLLKHVDGATRIILFDHTIRRANPNAHRAPVTRVHIDQTAASTTARVQHHLPNEAEELLKGRVRIINVWRPLNGAVESFPLAFADSTSVHDDALVGIEHRYPDRTGETAAVKYGAGQRWHYWSGVSDNERILLQCADTQDGARVPHTAFIDPRSGEGAKPRESIEVRALVFG